MNFKHSHRFSDRLETNWHLMSLKDIVRPNIYNLEPYRCARDDFSEGVLLDANENTHGTAVHDLTGDERSLELNRYPDPHQLKLKKLIARFRGNGLSEKNLYLGVGSDEAIDSLIRAVCVPGKDKLLICPPTYGMYSVSAEINDVGIVKVPLDLETFELRPQAVLEKLNNDPSIKLIYLCSPGNPTGKRISEKNVLEVVNGWAGGLVVIDEAYIDFTDGMPSLARLVIDHPRIAVLQTLSKSFGLAGLRLGMCFASAEMASILNAMKAPYNISSTTSAVAARALSPESISIMKRYVHLIQKQREVLIKGLSSISGIGRVRGGLDANFVLVEILDKSAGKPSNERAQYIYSTMAREQKIVIRFRGKELGCEGCVRISIGTEAETEALLQKLTEILK